MAIDWAHFTPWASLGGGLLIGLAAALLLLASGRIAGISGILGGLVPPRAGESAWRLAFVAGLLVAPAVLFLAGVRGEARLGAGPGVIALAGLLVGLGTSYASGCTSGHGVCGIARLSPRSLIATALFMGAGLATVFVVRHLA
jgi:uncharacterized membrane protein YedE/YeeE